MRIMQQHRRYIYDEDIDYDDDIDQEELHGIL